MSTGALAILTDVFRGFPQSTLSSGRLRRISHYRFFMVPFPLIICESFYHPTLRSLDPDFVFSKSYPCNRPWRPIGLWDVEAPTFSLDNRLTDGGKVTSHMRWSPFTIRTIPGTHFCYRLSHPQSHIAAGRIRSTDKLNNLIGNRTRYVSVCSIVPRPTTVPRTPSF
jgi:hypothetical protein